MDSLILYIHYKNSIICVLIKFVIFLTLFAEVLCERKFEMKIVKYTCQSFNTSIVESLFCNLTQEAKRTYAHSLLRLNEPLSSLPVHIRLDGLRWNFIDVKFDICNILNVVAKHSFLRQVKKEVQRAFGEMPTCPIKAHFNYTIKRYYIDADGYPRNLPAGMYRYQNDFYKKDKIFGQVVFKINVVYK